MTGKDKGQEPSDRNAPQLDRDQLRILSDLMAKSPENIEESLEEAPPEVRAILMRGKFQQYSMPVPPAEVLRELEDIVPNAGERLFKMAEARSEIANEERKTAMYIAKQDSDGASFGRKQGTYIVYVLIALTVLFVYTGRDSTAIWTGLAAAIGPVSALLLNLYDQVKNKEDETNDTSS